MCEDGLKTAIFRSTLPGGEHPICLERARKMTASSRRNKDKTKTAATPAEISSDLVETLMKANAQAAQVWLEGWFKLVNETADFTTKRWGLDADFMEKLATCRTPVDVMQLQAEFMQRAMQDYIKETSKLVDMETDAAVSGINAIDQGVKKAKKS